MLSISVNTTFHWTTVEVLGVFRTVSKECLLPEVSLGLGYFHKVLIGKCL